MTHQGREQLPGAEGGGLRSTGNVVELGVLVPVRMAAALESAANRRGLSMGQMMRRVVRDFLAEADEGNCSSSP